MKFPHLPIGALFEFEGKVYTKVSPLVAAAKDGSGQRVIPRYAVLRPVGEHVPAGAATHSRQHDPDRLRAAFASYETDALRLLEAACGEDADHCDALKAELVAAGKRLLNGL